MGYPKKVGCSLFGLYLDKVRVEAVFSVGREGWGGRGGDGFGERFHCMKKLLSNKADAGRKKGKDFHFDTKKLVC